MKQNTTPASESHPHYPWGASSAKQWRGCPGSVNLSLQLRKDGKLKEDSSTSYSREGTEAHDWADRCLRGEITIEQIPPDFRQHLTGYIELARELANESGSAFTTYYEQLVPLFYNPEKHGTVDYAVFGNEAIHILDLKYGAGVPVDADENDQLIIYGISLIRHHAESNGIELSDIAHLPVKMFIYQPRHHSFDGLPSSFALTVRDLMDYAMDIEVDYQHSKLARPDELRPSTEACQFCDARRVCTKRVIDLFDGIPDELNPLTGEVDVDAMRSAVESGQLSDEIRLAVFQKGKEIAKFFEELNDDTIQRIESGHPVEGLKTVDGGPGNRTWSDPEAAEVLLRKLPIEYRYKPRQVVSPAQAEAGFKKAGIAFDSLSKRFQTRFNRLISRPEGKPRLALASDKKPARVPVIQQFDDELEIVVDESDCF